MPAYRLPPTGRFHDWKRLVSDARKTARRHPGKWWLALPDEPQRVVTTIRQRSHPNLRLDDGTLEAKADLAAPTRAGQRRANVYVRFTPSHLSLTHSVPRNEHHGEQDRT
jgi:hypothetical protein